MLTVDDEMLSTNVIIQLYNITQYLLFLWKNSFRNMHLPAQREINLNQTVARRNMIPANKNYFKVILQSVRDSQHLLTSVYYIGCA